MEAKECRSWPPSACCQPALPGSEQLHSPTVVGPWQQRCSAKGWHQAHAQASTMVLAAVWGLHTDKQHREIPSTGRTLGGTKSGNTSKREAGSRERLGWEMTSVSCLQKLAGPLRDDLKRFGHGDIPLLAVRDCLGHL